jgi:hypothetical protein
MKIDWDFMGFIFGLCLVLITVGVIMTVSGVVLGECS